MLRVAKMLLLIRLIFLEKLGFSPSLMWETVVLLILFYFPLIEKIPPSIFKEGEIIYKNYFLIKEDKSGLTWPYNLFTCDATSVTLLKSTCPS